MKSLCKILRIVLVSLCLVVFSACSFGPVVLEKDINVQVTQDFKKISAPIYFSKKIATKPKQSLNYWNDELMKWSGWFGEMDGREALDKSLSSVVNNIFEKPNVASCADANYCVELINIYETEVFNKRTPSDIIIKKFLYNTTINVKDKAGKSVLVREVTGEATSAEFDQEVDKEYLIELAITRTCQQVSNALLGIKWN